MKDRSQANILIRLKMAVGIKRKLLDSMTQRRSLEIVKEPHDSGHLVKGALSYSGHMIWPVHYVITQELQPHYQLCLTQYRHVFSAGGWRWVGCQD